MEDPWMKNALAHIGVLVSDLKISQNFYENILGFHKVWENINPSPDGDVQVVFVEKDSLVIELIKMPNLEERRDGVVDHFAISVKDLEEVIEELQEKNVIFEEGSYCEAPHVFERGSKWIMLRGPNNERIELNERL